MTLLPHVLRALQQGFHVFPCNARGAVDPDGNNIEKVAHLTTPGKPWKLKWSEVATNDVNQCLAWWGEDPFANIGVACLQSNLLVVDCDVKPEGDGGEQYAAICDKYGGSRAYEAWETYTVRTGSGGVHLYYRWPPSIKASQASIAPLVDVRTNGGQKGGYVLGAGSQSSKGPYAVELDVPVLAAPSWLVALVTEPPRIEQPRDIIRQPGSASFSGLVDAVAYAAEGNRNFATLWAARSMCSDGATEREAEDLLLPAARAAGLSEKEARDTIRSAFRLQKLKEGRA